MTSNKTVDKTQLIYEAILTDKVLKKLKEEKIKIYSITPLVGIFKDGEIEVILESEIYNPAISRIDFLIAERIKEIKHFFS